MSEPVLLVERDEGIATLTLNRPEALNALSHELRSALTDAFRALAGDEAVGAVVLTGAGRAFSAGLDLKELGGETDEAADTRDAVTDGDVVRAMQDCSRPIVGAINGFAITGGFELALACDVLVCSTEARFADTHARVGILPGWGLSQKLPRLIGPYRAKELSLTGNFLEAEQAERWGLANRVVPPEELLPTARALARDMLSCDPDTMRGYLALIDAGYALPFGDAMRLESARSRAHVSDVTPEAVAERRRAIQARGRSQSEDPGRGPRES